MLSKFQKKRKRQNILFSFFLVIGFILIIAFLVLTNWKISQKRALLTAKVDSLKKEIQISEEKNKALKEGVLQAGSEEYLEKVAREQLGLKKPGEEIVVLQKEGAEEQPRQQEKQEKTSWWQWLKSFWRD